MHASVVLSIFHVFFQTCSCLAEPDDESATWITVFGYDPAQANFVLQHFSHLGTIEKYIVSPRISLLIK